MNNKPQFWTPEDIATLNRMQSEGVSLKDIALALGRSYINVVGKCRAMRESTGTQRSRRSPLHQASGPLRKCLSCRRPFHSEHRLNYMCPSCTGTEAYR